MGEQAIQEGIPQETPLGRQLTFRLNNPSAGQPIPLSPREKIKIESLYPGGEGATKYFEGKIIPLTQTFERYLLDGLEVPVPVSGKTLQVYMIGCGSWGAEEAWAMHRAATRFGLKVNCTGIDFNKPAVDKSKGDWEKWAAAGLVPEKGGNFEEENAQASKIFDNIDNSMPLLIVMRHPEPIDSSSPSLSVIAAFSRGKPISTPKNIVENCVGIMEKVHREGIGTRLLITTNTEDRDVVMGAVAEALRDTSKKLSSPTSAEVLKQEPNHYTTGKVGHNDDYVAVVGYKSQL